MKLLLDENIPPSLVQFLNDIKIEARHVNEIGYNNTPDFKIAEFAANTGEIILTHDTDFGTILALSGLDRPSVILIRWQIISTQTLFDFLKEHLITLEDALNDGAFVVVEQHKIRLRKLPILK